MRKIKIDELFEVPEKERDLIVSVFTRLILGTLEKRPGKHEIVDRNLIFETKEMCRMAVIVERLGGLEFREYLDIADKLL